MFLIYQFIIKLHFTLANQTNIGFAKSNLFRHSLLTKKMLIKGSFSDNPLVFLEVFYS